MAYKAALYTDLTILAEEARRAFEDKGCSQAHTTTTPGPSEQLHDSNEQKNIQVNQCFCLWFNLIAD